MEGAVVKQRPCPLAGDTQVTFGPPTQRSLIGWAGHREQRGSTDPVAGAQLEAAGRGWGLAVSAPSRCSRLMVSEGLFPSSMF